MCVCVCVCVCGVCVWCMCVVYVCGLEQWNAAHCERTNTASRAEDLDVHIQVL